MATQMVSAEAEEVPRSISRLLDVLEITVDASPVNLSGVAEAAGLTPTTTLRYIRALETRGYLARLLDGSYTPGRSLARLAASVVSHDRIDRLVAASERHLDDLVAVTGESAYLAILDGAHAVYLAAAQSERAIRHVGWVGQRVPVDGTAVGAALQSPGSPVHRVGAVESDIAAVALGVESADGLVVALSVIGPSHRFDSAGVSRTATALIDAVHNLERDARLGDGGSR